MLWVVHDLLLRIQTPTSLHEFPIAEDGLWIASWYGDSLFQAYVSSSKILQTDCDISASKCWDHFALGIL